MQSGPEQQTEGARDPPRQAAEHTIMYDMMGRVEAMLNHFVARLDSRVQAPAFHGNAGQESNRNSSSSERQVQRPAEDGENIDIQHFGDSEDSDASANRTARPKARRHKCPAENRLNVSEDFFIIVSPSDHTLQEEIRTDLQDRCLLIRFGADPSPLRSRPSNDEIIAFENGEHPGPQLEDMRLDWVGKPSSLWNTTAVKLLAHHYVDKVRSHEYVDPPLAYESWMTTKWATKSIQVKLSDSRSLYKKIYQPIPGDTRAQAVRLQAVVQGNEQKRQQRRRRARKANVSRSQTRCSFPYLSNHLAS